MMIFYTANGALRVEVFFKYFFVSVLATNPTFNLSALLKFLFAFVKWQLFSVSILDCPVTSIQLIRLNSITSNSKLNLHNWWTLYVHIHSSFFEPTTRLEKINVFPSLFEHGEAARRNFHGKCGDLWRLWGMLCVRENSLDKLFSISMWREQFDTLHKFRLKSSILQYSRKGRLSLDDPEKASNICPFTCLLDILRYYVLLPVEKRNPKSANISSIWNSTTSPRFEFEIFFVLLVAAEISSILSWTWQHVSPLFFHLLPLARPYLIHIQHL